MTFAFNELESLLKKAASGAGFSVGHAMVIASAGVWLGRRGFAVCDIVGRAVAGGPRESVVRSVDGVTVFEAARVGVDGVAAVDLLLAGVAGDSVTLEDLDEPRLLIGLAGVAAKAHGVGFAIGTEACSLVIGDGSAIAVANVQFAGGETVVLRLRPDLSSVDGAALASRYDPAATADGSWTQIEQLAHKTYVPASDASRLSGAGAGLTDND